MNCPFPGMDPYLERSALWPDFHDRLITHIAEQLQPVLRPRYAALTQDRLVLVEHERPVYPDVSVIETGTANSDGGTAVLAPPVVDQPLVIELEEFREPVIHIIEPAAGNRVVTSIEILSPDNKSGGSGLDSYQRKRSELLAAGASLVEIDLLRAGQRRFPESGSVADRISSPYVVLVTRRSPAQYEVYEVRLQDRLPRVSIPLASDDTDVRLDLQAAFERCWTAGPYPALLGYDADPPGSVPSDELEWCRTRIAEAGRPA
jgi:hypothetical protein